MFPFARHISTYASHYMNHELLRYLQVDRGTNRVYLDDALAERLVKPLEALERFVLCLLSLTPRLFGINKINSKYIFKFCEVDLSFPPDSTLSENRLLVWSFETIVEYMFILREMSLAAASCGKGAMIYAAAAVSDFYVPEVRINHK